MKAFVIPDIHLKPWIIDKAEDIIKKGEYDKIVFLGDFVDDWHQEGNIALYDETFERLQRFIENYPDSHVTWGNHDMSYLWWERESGYSDAARDTAVKWITKLEYEHRDMFSFVYRVDNVIFSHAGITRDMVACYNKKKVDLDRMISSLNIGDRSRMWKEYSPLWARPGRFDFYPKDYLQIAGHTPVRRPVLYQKNNLLVVDTFSTYRDGRPVGNEKFVWVDTETKEFGVAGSSDENDIRIQMSAPGDPAYKTGDHVAVCITDGRGEKSIKNGEVYVVDAYGTIDQDEEPSYDIMVDDGTEKCLYKHIPESEICTGLENDED
ncbi:MAG: metallophosphoesterase [Lachnospiraceae bacterium]|nr:metallophosphoesterase [Lachnospiraceae bacterium]